MAGSHRDGSAPPLGPQGGAGSAEVGASRAGGLTPADTLVEARTSDQVLEWVCQQAHQLDFFRALLLLQRTRPESARLGEDGPIEHEAVRLRASLDLAFPAADIDAIDQLDQRALLSANFLGLYGVDSPLPAVYAEQLAQSQGDPEGQRIRAFLDVFQHRLHSLLFRAWKRSRPISLTGSPDAIYDHVLSLVGYSQRLGLGGSPAPRLLEARLQVMRARTSRGLELMLRLRLRRPLRVAALQRRRVRLPDDQRGRLGVARSVLGSELVLGRNAVDRNAIRVELDLERYADWVSLMPEGPERNELDRGVSAYLRDPVAHQVQLTLPAAEVPPWPLGRGDGRMGRNVWLGRPQERARMLWHARG